MKLVIKSMFFSLTLYLVFNSLRGDKKLKQIIGAGGNATSIIEKISRYVPRLTDKKVIQRRIRRAGNPFNLTPELYYVLKFAFPIFFLLIQFRASSSLLYLSIGLILSFFIPDLFLFLAIQDRKKSIVEELPETVDIFEVASSAGIDTGKVFKLAAEFADGKELKKELMYLAAGYVVTKDKERVLKKFKDNIGLYDTDIFTLALLQGDITGKTEKMLGALSLIQNNNVILKIQREAKSVEYKVLLACILMAVSSALIYFYPYFINLESGLTKLF